MNLKNGQRNGSLRNGCSFWFLGDDESAGESFVFDHLIAQKLGQSFSRGDRSRLLSPVFFQSTGHGTVFGNQTEQLGVRDIGSCWSGGEKGKVENGEMG